MTETHSIWLMAAAEDQAFFDTLIRRLAGTFNTTTFCPHLTLVEDMQRPAAELADLLARNFAGQQAFDSPVCQVSGTTMFYRSLFAMFEPTGQLRALKELAIRTFEKGDIESFMPHVSLAYGVPEDRKNRVMAELDRELRGRSVRFDSIVVAASGQNIPIEEWQIAYSHALNGKT